MPFSFVKILQPACGVRHRTNAPERTYQKPQQHASPTSPRLALRSGFVSSWVACPLRNLHWSKSLSINRIFSLKQHCGPRAAIQINASLGSPKSQLSKRLSPGFSPPARPPPPSQLHYSEHRRYYLLGCKLRAHSTGKPLGSSRRQTGAQTEQLNGVSQWRLQIFRV